MPSSHRPPLASFNWPVRLMVVWVLWVHRHAVLTLATLLVMTVGAVYYSVTHFAINTDTSAMISPDLPFQQRQKEKAAAFPLQSNTLVVVIDAPGPDAADAAASKLTAALKEKPDIFGPVFDPEGMAFFKENGLLFADMAALENLADSLARAQPFLGRLSSDPSIRGFADLLTQALENPEASRAFDLKPVLLALLNSLQDETATLPWRNLITGQALDTPGRRVIVLNPALDYNALTPGGRAMDGVREIAEELELTPQNGITVRLTGSVALEAEELASVEQGMGLAGALSFVLVVGFLLLGLRSGRLFVAVLLALVIGLTWTAALAFLAVGRLNMVSVAFAVLFLGLSVDFGIHYGLRLREIVVNGQAALADALSHTVKSVGAGLLLSALAAAIGFFSFSPTDYLGFAELGLIAGTGMGIALFVNVTVITACLTLWPLRAGDTLNGRPKRRLSPGLAKVFVGFMAIFTLISLFLAPQARFDFDPLSLKDPNAESVVTLRDLARQDGRSLYKITIIAPDLGAADRLAEGLRTLPEVAEATTLSDHLPQDQDDKLAVVDDMAMFLLPALTLAPLPPPSEAENMAAIKALIPALEEVDDPALKPLAHQLAAALTNLTRQPDSAASLARVQGRWLGHLPQRLDDLRLALNAAPVDLADLPDQLKARMLAEDGRAEVSITPSQDISDPEELARFVEAVRTFAPELTGGATGAPVSIYESGRAVLSALVQAAALTFVLLVGVIWVMTRRLLDVVLVFTPVVLAGLYTAALTVLLGISFNFANVIVLPLLFGLGVAGAIHLVLRWRLSHKLNYQPVNYQPANYQAQNPEDQGSRSTPRAVVFSALTTIGSFGSIALSAHAGTASMGVLLTLAVSMSLVATLAVLPLLLQRLEPIT